MPDHVSEAERHLNEAWEAGDQFTGFHIAAAQTHATLALVEQQRIANLITLVFRRRDPDAYNALYHDRALRPEILAALVGDSDGRP